MAEPRPPQSPDVGAPVRARLSLRRPDWAVRFLEVFAATGSVRLSAGAAGVSRDAPYKRARRSARFAEHWAKA